MYLAAETGFHIGDGYRPLRTVGRKCTLRDGCFTQAESPLKIRDERESAKRKGNPQKRKRKDADGRSSSIGCRSPVLTDKSTPRPERKDEQRDAKRGKLSPTCFPKWERQTVVLVWHPDHTAGPARSTSVKPISDVVPLLHRVYHLFMGCGAPAAHRSLLGDQKNTSTLFLYWIMMKILEQSSSDMIVLGMFRS